MMVLMLLHLDPLLNLLSSRVQYVLYAGPQKFNENKTPLELTMTGTEKIPLKKCQLNFYLPDYNPNRKIDFVIKLFLVKDEEETLGGEYNVSTAEFVQIFNEEKSNSVRKTEKIGSFLI